MMSNLVNIFCPIYSNLNAVSINEQLLENPYLAVGCQSKAFAFSKQFGWIQF